VDVLPAANYRPSTAAEDGATTKGESHTQSCFSRVGVDYAGPMHLKIGSTRKPTIVKCYICIFVCLSVKAVHIDVA
jgi:hypothetical protein